MKPKFKVGDWVVRKPIARNIVGWTYGDTPMRVQKTYDNWIEFDMPGTWNEDNFTAASDAMNEAKAGVKHDQGKPSVVQGVIQRFPRAIVEIAKVSDYGKRKYGSFDGWETVPDAFNRYTDAMGRHLVGEKIEVCDEESGLLQIAQVAWGALARLELFLREREKEPKS